MGLFQFGQVVMQEASTATAGGTTTLVNTSKQIQYFTGSSGQTIVLPDATTMVDGQWFEIYNGSTGALTIEYNGGASFLPNPTVSPGGSLTIKLVANGTSAGTWAVQAGSSGVGGGGSKNYLSAITTSNGTNNGNGNFELGSLTGWETINLTTSGTIPVTVTTPGVGFTNVEYVFVITSGNAVTGDTYTNNGHTFTFLGNSTATLAVATGTGAPASSGTLTKSTGSGSSTIAFTSSKSTAPFLAQIFLESSGTLSGNYSVDFSSTGPASQGDTLISSVFNIDSSDQAKVMQISFDYKLVTGSPAIIPGNSSNTFAIYVYDVTNAAWIQPAGVFNINQSSGVGKSTATFQTTSNSTQYQLAIVTLNSATAGYSLYMDDFSVGPQIAPMAPAMSDPVAYTPTVTGFGTVSNLVATSSRQGAYLLGEVSFQAGTTTASALSVSIGYNGGNQNVSINSSLFPSASSIVGTMAQSGSTAASFYVITPNATSNPTILDIGVQASGSGGLNSATGATLLNNVFVSLTYCVPINGWSSNTSASADTDTRVVAMGTHLSTNTAVGTNSVIPYNTVDYDTHAGFSTSTNLYTVPVSGYYRISGISFSSTGTASLHIYKNGSNFKALTALPGTSIGTSGSTTLLCSAGDTLGLYTDNAQTYGGGVITNSSTCTLIIERLSGPAVVTATESVNAAYYSSAGQSISTGAQQITCFDTKEFDSHNAFASNAYVAPVSGKYSVSVCVSYSIGASNAYDVQTQVRVNGTPIKSSDADGTIAAGTANVSGQVDCLLALNAGDSVTFGLNLNTATGHSITGGQSATYFGIVRVGN